MPEAIATTKRKFYKALESLNSTSSTRPAEPATKRVRRSLSTSTSTRVSSVTKVPESNGETSRKPPNYSPWSHETFLARLKTYSSVSLWHPKPEAISEVEWARRGWVCVDVNTVACKGGCEKRVVVSLLFDKTDDNADESNTGVDDEDSEDESMKEDALVARYQSLLVDGHSTACPWHKAGCKDDIYHLQVVRPSIWQPELRKRYQSLRELDPVIRDVNVTTIPHESANSLPPERLLADVPSDLLDEADSTSKDSARALDIALHGWRGSQDSGNDLLHCDACFQRVGLWMYQPGYQQSRASSDDDDESMATLDLLELHRDHCPWRNPGTQKASGTLSGLNASQILQRVVSTYAREQRRKSDMASKTPQQLENDDQVDDEDLYAPASPAPSKEEVEQQDKERESKLKRLKSLFSIKRRPTVKPAVVAKVGR
ncbi:hypothetical protein LTR56_007493 [Elasticomyces elasticus]|nr:hypothetical protein LTR56_007493 [Elasticomyces elasticus]KAK3668185.1 hypothetical protein LTR22_000870 [Elasticomyces elasticus]KAK4921369.1 hypothetical protein LTR49_011199 [Elasticomyces elasticus]KAK5769488.1 hypothetical protein LTS12_000415 [Elasticomyces elasticus]